MPSFPVRSAGLAAALAFLAAPLPSGAQRATAASARSRAIAPAADSLSAEERRIVAWVDAHTEDAIALLERIVDINSGTMNPAGVRRVGDVLRSELDALGFRTRWIEMPDSVGRAGHLFAERSGTTGKRILLIGHLDTVFEEDSPFQTFTRQGDTARGPGVDDMKGGDVVIVAALQALASVGALDDRAITVAFTGDEEAPGAPLSLVRRDLIEAAKRSDVALEFEGQAERNGREYATVARRSASGWTLTTRGVAAHSSGVFGPRVGSGAIFEAARILTAFHDSLAGERYLTFNPGVIVGGTDLTYDVEGHRGTAFGKDNVVADSVVVSGDLRTISPAQLERTQRRMREIVARHLPRTSAGIVFDEGYPPMEPTKANLALMDRLNAVNRALGTPEMEAYDPGLRGASDASFAAPWAGASLAGMGTHGAGSHTVNERMDLSRMPLQIKRAALLIYRLTREPRPAAD